MGASKHQGDAGSDAARGRTVGSGSLRRAPWVLTAFLGVAGFLGYIAGGWTIDAGVFSDPLMWLLAAAFTVAEVFTIDLPFKSHRHSYSMAEVPAVLGLFYLEPGALIVASLLGMSFEFVVLRRQRGLKLIFNLCLQFADIVLLLLVFEAIARSRTPTDATAMVAAYVTVVVGAVLSHAAVSGVISFVEGVWDRILFARGMVFGIATQLATASLGLIGVLLVDIDWRAIFILLFPIVVMYAAYRSIGHRVRVEEQLRVSELRLGALIRASSDVTALVDRDLSLQYVSDAARDLFDVDPDELRGRDATHLIDAGPEETTRFRAQLEQVRRGSEPIAFDISCSHRDGSDMQLEVSLTNLLFDPGVGGILMSIRDVTERRRLEDRLTQSQKMDAIGQLAGGIAHDFNNLLGVIQNYATFVKQDLPPTSPSVDDVDEIVAATQTAATLTHQLLSFSRKEIVSPKVVSVNEVVSSVHRMLARTIEESIELRTGLAQDPPYVKIDAGRLEQLLINLAVNAKDAMPDGGTIIFGTSRARVEPSLASDDLAEGDYVVLTVEDTGLGIPPALKERIFEPFFTTKMKGQGTGLGLATVYGIVKQFNGHIEVESEVGRGSTFKIFLPVAEDTDLLVALQPAPPSLKGSTGTILVAEDSEPLRKLVRRILSNSSYSVLDAGSGVDAFRLWQEHANEIDLLVTDVVMPRMSGRELSELTGLPTVFVSGYTDEILSQEDVANGGYFLQKPFSSTELLSVVAEALSASRSRTNPA